MVEVSTIGTVYLCIVLVIIIIVYEKGKKKYTISEMVPWRKKYTVPSTLAAK